MLDIQVTAHQPLALGVHPAGTAPVPTRLHVPGSVVRGALAAAWIAEHGLPTKVPAAKRREFLTLFEDEVCYGPLFATGSQVVPLSVLRCKYRNCATVVDEAFVGTGDENQGEPSCTHGPLASGRGEVEFTGAASGPYVTQSTHLQIDDARQVAEERLLFTRRALTHRDAEGAERTFHGRIALGSRLSDESAAWLSRSRRLRLGGRRGTSGAVTYTPSPAATLVPPTTGHRIALRLIAPAILTDPSGLPLDLADPQALRAALDAELSSLLGGAHVTDVERVWARRERVGGWHAASRLPKPVELAVSAGSVLLLGFNRPPAPDGLLALAGRGIGLRRNEGFGALETATTAWEQVPGPEPVATGQDRAPDPAEAYARMILDTGHGAWFADNLRSHIQGPTAQRIGLLERPRMRRLTPDQRRALTRMLLDAPADVLDRTLGILSALNRLMERQTPRS
ncbi:type III-B CRISPR module-associated Cmr3 family protein [Streptomyces yerevanensis]|uniref:type III-B CRISPR module-associated Cmr3 family protein n=1 Tax=Streptomyces yerevanensis TaxID=66378 RepID=UPI0005259248|nr:type III-B CRISPR module-associated Cmr3 family protein [Streptomyces yerevanensis]